MKKGYKFAVKYPRQFTEKMKTHLDKVRPKAGYPSVSNTDGRPTKEAVVSKYRELNPEATRYRCAKDTGLDYKTVCKWWEPEKK